MKKKETHALSAQLIHDGLSRFLSYMPNPDDVATGWKGSYDVYREMRKDPRIKSLLNLVKSQALNLPLVFIRQKDTPDEVFEFISTLPVFTSKLFGKAKRMLSCLDYGFSITEAIWELDERGWVLDNLITRKPEHFVFDTEWRPYRFDNGVKVPLSEPYKWLQLQHDIEDESPYGTSMLKCVYWPWKFKKAGYDFWLLATEKFSVKSLIALFECTGQDEGTVRKRAAEISEMFAGIEAGSAAAVGNISDLKEISMDGDVSGFQALVEACDAQISYGLTGQFAATGENKDGSRALAETQLDVMKGETKSVALELQAALQKAVNWQVELRFGEGVQPPLIEFDLADHASPDTLLKMFNAGLPVSRSWLYAQYGLKAPLDKDDEFIATPNNSPQVELADPKKKLPTWI